MSTNKSDAGPIRIYCRRLNSLRCGTNGNTCRQPIGNTCRLFNSYLIARARNKSIIRTTHKPREQATAPASSMNASIVYDTEMMSTVNQTVGEYFAYQIEQKLNLEDQRMADRQAADEWKAKHRKEEGTFARLLLSPAYLEEKRRQENARLARLQQQELDYWREATKPTLVMRSDAVMTPSGYYCSICCQVFPWDEEQADAAFKTCGPCFRAHHEKQLAQNPIDYDEWDDIYISDSDDMLD